MRIGSVETLDFNQALKTGAPPSNTRGNLIPSKQTVLAFQDPVVVLALREVGGRVSQGSELLVFSINPQRAKFERRAKVAIQQTRHGYLVTQAGLAEPHFTFSGNFGWKTRKIILPPWVTGPQTAAGLATAGVMLQNTGNRTQELDGRQSWYALRDLIDHYFEDNVRRLALGEVMLEMVLYDTLHSLRWVVVPTGEPLLDHTANEQGKMPYMLELIGVYDDGIPPPRPEVNLWSDLR